MNYFTRFLLLILLFVSFSSFGQDTIVVQTFNYDSITSRRGVWQFPEGESYRKILMYYNLKCDAATTHDHYACGEWDYLTYTTIYEHTGEYDSVLSIHPNYTYINNQSPDSVILRDEPAYSFYQNDFQSILYNDTISLEQYHLSSGASALSNRIFNTDSTDGRVQIIYSASDLLANNMTAGEISGMKFHIANQGSDLRKCMVRLKNVTNTTVSGQTLLIVMDTVFYGPIEINDSEWLSINYTRPFEWDGTSDILVDISFNNDQRGISTEVYGNMVYKNTLDLMHSSAHTNYALDFDGEMDFLDAKDGNYFNSDFTFEVWLNKKSNNNWSRVFDFGNGPNKNNIIIALTKNTSGKLSFHVNTDSQNRSFELDDPLPLNQWTHLTLKMMYNIQGWVFLNGELVDIGLLTPPEDVVRTNNFIGKSNWANDKYAGMLIDEFRLYDYSREDEDIALDPFRTISDPNNEEGLVVYYSFNKPDVDVVNDLSGNGKDAQCYGLPSWSKISGNDLKMDFEKEGFIPEIIFERLESDNSQLQETVIIDSIRDSKIQIVYFNADSPTVAVDTISTYTGGYRYVYHNNQIIDSVLYTGTTLYKEDYPYYEEPYEIINPYELGRFITPYGINLDLGNDGFTWVYDVTDYAEFLHGAVDISSGNQQELLDVKFLMIKGTAPREVINIQRPWGYRKSYYYKDLSDNSKLSNTVIDILPETESVKVTTRLTGHGHNSNTGDYPHCCEWKDNTHYLLANDEEVASWHIWKRTECAMNPVYPQGGTWLGAREGWCPGDKVKDFSFNLTDYIVDNKITLDYDITKVPENNQGMGWGNYVISMHLFEYAAQSHNIDAELYDVITPNDIQYYSRKNPICSNPKVIIRNNGVEPLTSLNIEYSVSGGDKYIYHWTGDLASNSKEIVELPIEDDKFWLGDGNNVFTAKVLLPNKSVDEYTDNDEYNTNFNIPDLINTPVVLKMRMNKRPGDFGLTIKNLAGDVVFSRDDFESETIYMDTINLKNGCYTLSLTDTELTGLSYWAWGAQGSGYLLMYDDQGTLLKNFESEFGGELRYSFSVGSALYINDPNIEGMLNVYPNPTKGKVKIDLKGIVGNATLKVVDMMGKVVVEKSIDISAIKSSIDIDITELPSGSYIVYFINDDIQLKKVIIKN